MCTNSARQLPSDLYEGVHNMIHENNSQFLTVHSQLITAMGSTMSICVMPASIRVPKCVTSNPLVCSNQVSLSVEASVMSISKFALTLEALES
jgi:hypothetical protein